MQLLVSYLNKPDQHHAFPRIFYPDCAIKTKKKPKKTTMNPSSNPIEKISNFHPQKPDQTYVSYPLRFTEESLKVDSFRGSCQNTNKHQSTHNHQVLAQRKLQTPFLTQKLQKTKYKNLVLCGKNETEKEKKTNFHG